MRPHPTPTPHMKGDNRRQRETRPLQSPRRRPHQPTPTPYIKGDNRRQWETTGDKTTSEPKKPTTPTNTKAARSKVALRTPTVNCLGKNHLYMCCVFASGTDVASVAHTTVMGTMMFCQYLRQKTDTSHFFIIIVILRTSTKDVICWYIGLVSATTQT